MLNILTFTSLYPNAEQLHHGVFVENRLRHVHESGEARITVAAPVAYFPIESKFFGRYGAVARVPETEERFGIQVHHPRYLLIPKVSMNWAPELMYAGVRRRIKQLDQDSGPFDLIDAHYFYPDGVVASRLAHDLNIPFVITGRGSDLSELTDYPIPRRKILAASSQAAHLITVCQALKDKLAELGVPGDHVSVFRNGVDLNAFQPGDRQSQRHVLNATRPLFVSVGHLIERKGHHLVIEALAQIPEAELFIVGTGPEETTLRDQVERLKLTDRVRFLGQRPHHELKSIYGAADALVLASSREGWANVLLEAMACGTPAIATDVWGTREVVGPKASGILVPHRTADSLADAMKKLLAEPPAREDTRAYAEQFSWQETTQDQLRLFKGIVSKGGLAKASHSKMVNQSL